MKRAVILVILASLVGSPAGAQGIDQARWNLYKEALDRFMSHIRIGGMEEGIVGAGGPDLWKPSVAISDSLEAVYESYPCDQKVNFLRGVMRFWLISIPRDGDVQTGMLAFEGMTIVGRRTLVTVVNDIPDGGASERFNSWRFTGLPCAGTHRPW